MVAGTAESPLCGQPWAQLHCNPGPGLQTRHKRRHLAVAGVHPLLLGAQKPKEEASHQFRIPWATPAPHTHRMTVAPCPPHKG